MSNSVEELHDVSSWCQQRLASRAAKAGLHVVWKLLAGTATRNAAGSKENDKYVDQRSQRDFAAEVAMTRATAGLLLLVVAGYAPGSPAQEDDFAGPAPLDRPVPSDWFFAFGAGALALPSYAGAASTKTRCSSS